MVGSFDADVVSGCSLSLASLITFFHSPVFSLLTFHGSILRDYDTVTVVITIYHVLCVFPSMPSIVFRQLYAILKYYYSLYPPPKHVGMITRPDGDMKVPILIRVLSRGRI